MVDKEAIVIIAQATALPGNEELRAALDAVILPSLAEEGVQVFRIHGDIEKPGHFVFYKHFASQAALDSHFSSRRWSRPSLHWSAEENRISRSSVSSPNSCRSQGS
jgi:quinol monooxygenase YgiN